MRPATAEQATVRHKGQKKSAGAANTYKVILCPDNITAIYLNVQFTHTSVLISLIIQCVTRDRKISFS